MPPFAIRLFAPALIALAAVPAAACAQQAEAPSAAPVDPAKLAIAQDIIDLGFPAETREDVFFATMDQIVAQMREASLKANDIDDEEAIAILDQWSAEYIADSKAVLRTHIPLLMDGMAHSYAAIFTQQELEDIRRFISTPSGQRFFAMSSAVVSEPHFAAANQAYMDEAQAGLPAAMSDLMGRLQTYFSEKQARESQVES